MKIRRTVPWKIMLDFEKYWMSEIYIDGVYTAAVYGKSKVKCRENVLLFTSHLKP